MDLSVGKEKNDDVSPTRSCVSKKTVDASINCQIAMISVVLCLSHEATITFHQMTQKKKRYPETPPGETATKCLRLAIKIRGTRKAAWRAPSTGTSVLLTLLMFLVFFMVNACKRHLNLSSLIGQALVILSLGLSNKSFVQSLSGFFSYL